MDTRGSKTHQERTPQEAEKHPTEWAGDLNPNRMAGQNVGFESTDRAVELPTAYDVKEIHRTLADAFTDDDLKQIPIIRPGTRLQQGATYVDLADAPPREIKATGSMPAENGHYYVAKDRVPYELWNRLIGEEKT